MSRHLQPDVAAKWFLYSAVFWLLVPGAMGLALALFLYAPWLQDFIPASWRAGLTFGRLRPTHVNLALFGWLSMTYVGAMLYLTPRLVGAPLFSERLARITLVLWNLLALSIAVSLPMGFTQGREYAELAWPLDLLLTALWFLVAINVWKTVLSRPPGTPLYISVWSFMAASLIMPFVYIVGNKLWDPSGAYYGMNDAIINYFYVHNLFNVWFTTGGLGLALYLIPRLSGNPLFSHRLAIWGFTSVWTGQHHLLYGPGPEWLEIVSVAFSVLAAIPNTAFAINFVKTMEGAWRRVRHDAALAWVVTATVLYLFTCLQGVAQSFRTFNFLVHFTNWVIGHSHLAFFGAYGFYSFALLYHLTQRITGRTFDARLQWWHYGLTVGGLIVFLVDLWLAGLIQGWQWTRESVPFIETVRAMRPFYLVRLLAGAVIAVAQVLLVINLLRTVAAGRRERATVEV